MWSARAANPRAGFPRPVYYNSTAIDTGKGLKPRPVIYGVVRVESGTGFNPLVEELKAQYAISQLVGRIFDGTGVREHDVRRQMALHKRTSGEPDGYLVVIHSRRYGKIDLTVQWKSNGVEVVSFSEAGDDQEALLLMSPYSWVRTVQGFFNVARPVALGLLGTSVLRKEEPGEKARRND